MHPRASDCVEMVSLLAVSTGKVSSNSLGRKEKCTCSFSLADGKLSVILGSAQAFSSSHCCLEEEESLDFPDKSVLLQLTGLS